MSGALRPFPVDYVGLADAFSVLSYEARLEILDVLRFPKPLSEVRVRPHRVQTGHNPERPMSKQAVQVHLNKLVQSGIVHLDTHEPTPGQKTHYYTANAPRLYALSEDLRSLCVRYAARIPTAEATGTVAHAAARERPAGPALMLVHGLFEGQPFPLDPKTADAQGRWVIGRRPDAQILLGYDPFVSGEHAIITKEAAGFRITDARSSKNGTALNWRVLPKGGSDRLYPGDVIGVGRSVLVYASGARD